jgi:hypothetical protein
MDIGRSGVDKSIPVNPPPLHGSLPHGLGLPCRRHKSPARSPPNKKFVYFLQSPYLFTIDRLFPSIVKMFRINFYRVSLDFSFRNTKLIVVYVIERKTTPIRNVHLSEYYSDLSVSVSRYVDNDPLLAYGQRGRAHVN